MFYRSMLRLAEGEEPQPRRVDRDLDVPIPSIDDSGSLGAGSPWPNPPVLSQTQSSQSVSAAPDVPDVSDCRSLALPSQPGGATPDVPPVVGTTGSVGTTPDVPTVVGTTGSEPSTQASQSGGVTPDVRTDLGTTGSGSHINSDGSGPTTDPAQLSSVAAPGVPPAPSQLPLLMPPQASGPGVGSGTAADVPLPSPAASQSSEAGGGGTTTSLPLLPNLSSSRAASQSGELDADSGTPHPSLSRSASQINAVANPGLPRLSRSPAGGASGIVSPSGTLKPDATVTSVPGSPKLDASVTAVPSGTPKPDASVTAAPTGSPKPVTPRSYLGSAQVASDVAPIVAGGTVTVPTDDRVSAAATVTFTFNGTETTACTDDTSVRDSVDGPDVDNVGAPGGTVHDGRVCGGFGGGGAGGVHDVGPESGRGVGDAETGHGSRGPPRRSGKTAGTSDALKSMRSPILTGDTASTAAVTTTAADSAPHRPPSVDKLPQPLLANTRADCPPALRIRDARAFGQIASSPIEIPAPRTAQTLSTKKK